MADRSPEKAASPQGHTSLRLCANFFAPLRLCESHNGDGLPLVFAPGSRHRGRPMAPRPSRLAPHERTIHPAAFVALMALLMSLQALAIDAMLPALDEIASDLGTANPNDRQLVVGVFLMAAGAFSLIPGA